ncbi:MAG: hypothetical protein WA755_20170 [Candidatus Acidiferrales bacterium]
MMRISMKVGVVLCLLAGAIAVGTIVSRRAFAAPPEKYLHVRVNNSENKETVNVNLPLSLAEKILPTIHQGNLKDGKVTIGDAEMDNVDLRAILDAVRTAPDNEFVTVKSDTEDVRVAKSKGNLVVHVNETKKDGEKNPEKVDVTIPMSVVNALVPTDKREIDLVAAIHALADAGDTLLVTVHNATEEVRIWVDSNGSST